MLDSTELEPPPNPKREEIISHCPLLRAFITERIVPEKWLENLYESWQEVDGEICLAYGDQWSLVSVYPVQMSLESAALLNPMMSREEKFDIFEMLTCVGYEIGDYDDVDAVIEDVIIQLGNMNIVNPEFAGSAKDLLRAYSAVGALVQVGVYLRLMADSQNDDDEDENDGEGADDGDCGGNGPGDKPDETPKPETPPETGVNDPFADFINHDLNLDGLK